MGEVSAVRNARIVFGKDQECRYISHLDLNRVMLRAVQKSGLNIWRTEGFNTHPYITFALPLSLGYVSRCETMDFRLLDDDEDMDAVPAMLNACLPAGIRVYSCCDAVHKPADITAAVYTVELSVSPDADAAVDLYPAMTSFLSLSSVMVEKKTKKGMKTVDLRPLILDCTAERCDGGVRLTMTLPAGPSENINPSLFVTAFSAYCRTELYSVITREKILIKDGEPFV